MQPWTLRSATSSRSTTRTRTSSLPWSGIGPEAWSSASDNEKKAPISKVGVFLFLQVAWHALWCAFPSVREPRRDIVRTIRGGKEIGDGTFEMQNECAERDVSRNRTSPLLSRFFIEIPQPILRFSRKILPLRKKSATQLRTGFVFTGHRGSRNPLKTGANALPSNAPKGWGAWKPESARIGRFRKVCEIFAV